MTTTSSDSNWAPGRVSADRRADARRQLHQAATAIAQAGIRLLEHQPDYGEQSFQWIGTSRALAQGTVAAPRPFRPALRLSPPAFLLLDPEGGILRELPLDGRTREEALLWLETEIASLLGRPLETPLPRTADIEPHPVGTGAPFSAADGDAFAEVESWFATAHRLLGAVAAHHPGASAVRCWPHHFDIACLIALGDGPAHEETARSIGVGLSPGDTSRPSPYFYVTPWPYPSTAALPELVGGGTWNTEGWVGAVLDAATLETGVGAPTDRAERFLASAVEACQTLLVTP